MPEIHINYLAVLLAGLAFMVVGIIWYGPLFGKQWKTLMGLTDESMKSMKLKPMQAMAGGLVTSLIMAYVLAHDSYVWGQFFGTSFSQPIFALQLAFWIWLGYVATTQMGSVLWEGKSIKLFLINASNTLVALIVMSFILVYLQ